MNSIISSMIKNDNDLSPHLKENHIKEIIQELTLYILSKSDFFNHAAFYGGTALRIFHNLDRFSEDLDFSLKSKNCTFDINKYINLLENEFASFGLSLDIEIKEKNIESNIKSAFIKANTKHLILAFYNSDEKISDNAKTKIKLEIDTNPPDYANFETKYLLKPLPFEVSIYDLPSLFAGKIHAILCRLWKNRIKGRDLYDYVFYLSNKVEPNFLHLKARLIDSNYLKPNDEFDKKVLSDILVKHFSNVDIESAKKDVTPFIPDDSKMSIWSNDFFVSITKDYFN